MYYLRIILVTFDFMQFKVLILNFYGPIDLDYVVI